MKFKHKIPKNYKKNRLESWNELAEYWLEYIQTDDFHNNSLNILSDITLRYSQYSNQKAIDIGCGNGHFLNILRRKKNWERLSGIDFCKNMIITAEHINTTGSPVVEFYGLDVENHEIPVPSHLVEEFDIATSSFLLDEIEEIDSFFYFAKKVIRDKGHIICITLDYQREKERYKDHFKFPTDETILMSKELPKNKLGGELYRIFRPSSMITKSAVKHGLVMKESILLSPLYIQSRSSGPGVHICIWQKLEKEL